MTVVTWFAGYLVMVWLFGYSLGLVFLNLRRFVDKVK